MIPASAQNVKALQCLWQLAPVCYRGSAGCYQSPASGIGFRSGLDGDENTNIYRALTDAHKRGLLVTRLCVSERLDVLGPAERDALLDAGKSQTERDICQFLNGIFTMLLMRFSLCLAFTHTHPRLYTQSVFLGKSSGENHVCRRFNKVSIL